MKITVGSEAERWSKMTSFGWKRFGTSFLMSEATRVGRNSCGVQTSGNGAPSMSACPRQEECELSLVFCNAIRHGVMHCSSCFASAEPHGTSTMHGARWTTHGDVWWSVRRSLPRSTALRPRPPFFANLLATSVTLAARLAASSGVSDCAAVASCGDDCAFDKAAAAASGAGALASTKFLELSLPEPKKVA